MNYLNQKSVTQQYKLDFSDKFNGYSQMVELIKQEQSLNDSRQQDILDRVNAFAHISTLKEAKNLAKTNFPTAQEKTSFFVGNAKCTVINQSDKFTIMLDTEDEFIYYEFV